MSPLGIEDGSPETGLIVKVGDNEHVALVDAGWAHALSVLENRVRDLVVIDVSTAQTASDLQRRATTAATQLEDARKKVKQPFLDACRAIDEAATPPRLRIEAAKKRLQNGLTQFADSERARVAAEESARQAEIRRLEEVARIERERLAQIAAKAAQDARVEAARVEADRLRVLAENEAARAAGKAAPLDLGIEEEPEPAPEAPPPAPSEAEIRLQEAIHAPVPVAVAPIGVAMRVTLDIAKVDVDQLPAPYVQRVPLTGLLRSTYCTGWKDGDAIPVCPGVTFEVKRTPVSTRQRI